MNQPNRSSATRRFDALTPVALGSGLAFGHVVAAMSQAGAPGATTPMAALVFVVAAAAATVCGLAAVAASGDTKRVRQRIPVWIVATGAGILAALWSGPF